MQGIEVSHCNATIRAILTATQDFLSSSVDEALRQVVAYGKTDTLGLDAVPEIAIIDSLQRYDKYCPIITEEVGSQDYFRLKGYIKDRNFHTFFICDPTDRSSQLKSLLTEVEDRNRTVSDVMSDEETKTKWEEKFGSPASITGGSSAITCIRRGIPIFSVIVNYLTRQMFVSCSAGNYGLDLPQDLSVVDVAYVQKHGKVIFFHNVFSEVDRRRFVTFLGKSGYKENFIDSGLMKEEDMHDNLHYNLPGGPTRALYLSTLQPKDCPIGVVLSNGEKISEWVHWLPYLINARSESDQGEPALRLFEVYTTSPRTNKGMFMSTPPDYSIFRQNRSGRMIINVEKFFDFQDPSKVRSTLIMMPSGNSWAANVMKRHGYRPIEFFVE
jgi:hypothetical protein